MASSKILAEPVASTTISNPIQVIIIHQTGQKIKPVKEVGLFTVWIFIFDLLELFFRVRPGQLHVDVSGAKFLG